MATSPNIILATSDFFPQSWGGTETYVKALATHLKEKRFHVHIFTSLGDNEIQTRPLSWSDQRLHCTEYQFEGLSVWAFSHPVGRRQLYRKFDPILTDSWRKFFAYFQERTDSRPDSIQFHSFTSIIGLSLAIAFKNSFKDATLSVFLHTAIYCPKGTLFHLQRTECLEVLQPERCAVCILQDKTGLPPGLTNVFGRCLPQIASTISPFVPGIVATRTRMQEFNSGFRQLTQLADQWIVFANRNFLQLMQMGISEDKVLMVRHGISSDFFKQAFTRKPTRPVQFAYTGRIHPIKGIITLLSAWNETPEQPEQKQLTILGWHEQLPSQMKKIVNKYRYRRDIRWLGYISREQMVDLLQQIHAVVIPSEAAETGPLSFHEAVASGAWVIASDIGGNAELAELYGMKQWLFPPGAPAALSQLLMKWEQLPSPPPVTTVSRWDEHFEKLIPGLIT